MSAFGEAPPSGGAGRGAVGAGKGAREPRSQGAMEARNGRVRGAGGLSRLRARSR